MASTRRVVANDATGRKTAPASTTAKHGVRTFGTPYGSGRQAHGPTARQRSERSLRPAAGAPRLPGQAQEGARAPAGWAYVAGEPKSVVGPAHSRGICTYPTRTVPHDHLTSITNPVKRAEMMEVRSSRVAGYDCMHHDRGWVSMEKDKRDREGTSGSRAQAELDAQVREDAPEGHGLTLLKTSTRDLVDILRKELGLDVAMTAPEVISHARQEIKLEDIELPIAQDARRLVAALRSGTGAFMPAGGAAAGSTSGYTMGRVSTRPLR
jgi:hypothetical protein